MTTWINHTTGERPCEPMLWVDVMRFDGTIDIAMPARGWSWSDRSGIAAWRKSAVQFPTGMPAGTCIILRETA